LLLVPGPTLPELELSPPAFPLPAPVVPLFMVGPVVGVVADLPFESEVAPGPTLPELDAPGAGWVWADAMAVAPKSVAATRVESASLDCMKNLAF
jgi:hypothetical protein